MLKALEKLQTGVLPPKAFQSAVTIERVPNLQLSTHTIITPFHNTGISALDIDKAEDRYLLSGSKYGDLAIHNIMNTSGHIYYNAEVLHVIRRENSYAHKFTIRTVQWYPFDTGLFISSAMDHKLKIWDTNTLQPVDSISLDGPALQHHMSTIASQSSLIAVAMSYCNLNLIDPKTGLRTHELEAHENGVVSVRWSPTTEYFLASGGMDGKILFWDIRCAKGPLQSLDQHNGEAMGSKEDLIRAHNGHVNCMKFTDDGLFMVSHGTDRHLRMWDVVRSKNTLVNYGEVPADNHLFPVIIDVCCDSSRSFVFVPSDYNVIIYDLFKGFKSKVLAGHFNSVATCIYRASKHELYSAGRDMNILLYSADTKRELQERSSPPTRKRVARESSVVVESDRWSNEE